MRIVWGEARKLLWLRNLLIAAAIGSIYYWVFLWNGLSLFPNGHPATEIHQQTIAWHQEFGPTLEPDEAATIQTRLGHTIKRADAMIAADPDLAKAGIHTWRQLSTTELDNDTVDRARWRLLYRDGGLGWQIEATQNLLEGYQPTSTPPDANEALTARIESPRRVRRLGSLTPQLAAGVAV